MKRHAAHYLFLPGYGYLKHYAVEMEDGYAIAIFPLFDELENIEWHPGGVIALFPDGESGEWIPYLYDRFDFKAMLPADGTRHRRLL